MSLPEFQIVSDDATMSVIVGRRVYDKPELWAAPESVIEYKAQICGEPDWSKGPKAVYQHYASLLGPKFNRRFHAAHYWLWIGRRMTERSANMLRMEGRHWQRYHRELVCKANAALPYVNEAEQDGLFNLVPLIVAFGDAPQAIRRRIGQGAWRRASKNSVARNCLLMQAMQRVRMTGEMADPGMFVRLLEFPSGVLRWVHGATDDEVIAARITQRKRGPEFAQAMHLVRDAKQMLGSAFNPAWGYARILEEHDAATKAMMRGRFSDASFADDWRVERDGFMATLLPSQLDIATEGATQHHCVGSYARAAAQFKYAVFRIEGKERATAGIAMHPGGNRVDQVYAACNGMVSEACIAFAQVVATEYRASTLNIRRAA